MNKLESPLQLDQRIKIKASPQKVWEIFNDQELLPKWTTDVQKCHYESRMASIGQVRSNDCIVNGKKGTIRSRCIDLQPRTLAEFKVEHDTFGMNRMLREIGFVAIFNDAEGSETEFVMQSHYQTKNLFIGLMNPLIRRQMAKEVDNMLEGLKEFVESGQPNLKNPINQS
ncbi:MAG: SRPBCC family protein [Cyclobacteriaceae bacterium]